MNATIDPNNYPALEPPDPNIPPNFIDPPTIAGPLIVGLSVMIGVATLGFAARMFTRVYVMRHMQVEDYCLILGWAFFVVYQGCNLAQMPFSTGRHQWNVSLTQMSDFLKLLNYAEFFYGFSLCFTKLAILFQLKRIFRGTKRDSVYWTCISLMIAQTTYFTIAVIIVIAQCNPREKIWNPLLPGTCVDNNTNVVVGAGINLAFDFIMFLLPIHAILRLKIAIKRKLGIATVFATGLLACISSILRLYYSLRLINTEDVTFEVVNLSWTTCLEGAAAILVASFPVFPRLYRFLRGERPAGSSARPVYGHMYGSKTARSGRKASIGKPFSKKGGTGTVDSEIVALEEQGLRREWVPLEDGAGMGQSIERPLPAASNITKTVRMETQFEPYNRT